jgi:hypothetical protein
MERRELAEAMTSLYPALTSAEAISTLAFDACGRITGGIRQRCLGMGDGVSPAVILPGLAGPVIGDRHPTSANQAPRWIELRRNFQGVAGDRATIWTGLPACTP